MRDGVGSVWRGIDSVVGDCGYSADVKEGQQVLPLGVVDMAGVFLLAACFGGVAFFLG